MRIGDKIRKLRLYQRLTHQALADYVNCSEGAIRQLESGQIKSPRVNICCELAKMFNVSLDWLADDEVGWPPPESQEQQSSDIIRQALESSGLIGELSALERDLVSSMRKLRPDLRHQILGYIKGCLDSAQTPPTDLKNIQLDETNEDVIKGKSIIRKALDMEDRQEPGADNTGQSHD